jgi:chromosomal replication initiator protein
MEHTELWQTALSKIELAISRPSFLTWFQETGVTNIDEGVVTVFVPNGFAKEWLRNKYHKTILHALREISVDIKDISYIVGKPEATLASSNAIKERTNRKKRFAPANAFAADDTFSIKELSVNPDTSLNPRYTLDAFVVGSFNELAHAAAQSVIKNLGTSYNPLFIYGGVGLGKTHLVQAVGNEVLKQNSLLSVRYVPSEKFMGEVVDALKNQEMGKLKDKYRNIDLLIVDDIQFIARTEKMQEEFFHIFNSLYEKNKQIIISSDRPPHAMAALEERLRSRFEGGMIADIGLPDLETRLVILKTKIESRDVVIPEDVLIYIAENIKTNVRELEGALNRIVMASKLSNAPIGVEVARKVISNHLTAPNKYITVKKIIKAVSEFYELEERELIDRSRKKDVVKPRQIAMYLMREELKNSFPFIGEKFGGRDHTTAIHSCEKVAKELKINTDLEEEIRMIKDRILLG